MPRENYPPPPATFFVYSYSLVIRQFFWQLRFTTKIQFQYSTVQYSTVPPPTFLMFSLNALVLALITLATLQGNKREGPLIRILFPHFHGRKNRGRDVWQALELNLSYFGI